MLSPLVLLPPHHILLSSLVPASLRHVDLCISLQFSSSLRFIVFLSPSLSPSVSFVLVLSPFPFDD